MNRGRDRTEAQISKLGVQAEGAPRMWPEKGGGFESYLTPTVASEVGASNTGVLPRRTEHLDYSNIRVVWLTSPAEERLES